MERCLMCGTPQQEMVPDKVCLSCHKKHRIAVECSVCGLMATPATTDPMCEECNQMVWLLEKHKPLRARVPCDRCQGLRFVRFMRYCPPGALSPLLTDHIKSLVEKDKTKSRRKSDKDWLVEAYVCQGCGHVDLYVRNARDIPLGHSRGTELFEVPPKGPYR